MQEEHGLEVVCLGFSLKLVWLQKERTVKSWVRSIIGIKRMILIVVVIIVKLLRRVSFGKIQIQN